MEWDGLGRNWNSCTGRFYIVAGFHEKVLGVFSDDPREIKKSDGVNRGGEDGPIWGDGEANVLNLFSK